MEKQKSKATVTKLDWGLPLPLHIGLVIFSKLPFSHLPVCRVVCKSWNHLLLNHAFPPEFRLPNTIMFPTLDSVFKPFGGLSRFVNPKIRCFDIDTLSFVASCEIRGLQCTSFMNCCNGLLFFNRANTAMDCEEGNTAMDCEEGIFNPMTAEFFLTPIDKSPYTTLLGFGFTPTTKQYKLFKYEVRFTPKMKVLRFGMNNNQWTSLTLPSPLTLTSQGAYFDAVIYWAGQDCGNNIIYALDLETEQFKVSGVLKVGPQCLWVTLQPFNGTMYAIASERTQIEVWKMQEKDSWVREFIAPGSFSREYIRLVKAIEDEKIFLLSWNGLFCLSKSQMGMKKIKELFPHNTQYMGHCLLESIHFGSLSNILAGHIEDQGVQI